MDNVRRHSTTLLILACAFVSALLFARISAFGIWDPWELGTADNARRLLAGDRLDGHASFSTHLVSLGFRLFGVHEWAGRAPIAVGGVLTALLAYVLVNRYANSRAGFYAAIVTGTSPLFVFNARAMLGEAPSFAVQSAIALCAMGAVFPRRDGREPTAWQRAAFGFGLVTALALSITTRGALLGALPPLSAVALVALFAVPPGQAVARRIGLGMLALCVGLTLLVLRDVLADSMDHSYLLGGRVVAGAPPGFDAVIEKVFHAFAPWSALLPIAMAALWRDTLHTDHHEAAAEASAERSGARVLFLVSLAWSATACAAQTLYVSRYGRDVAFLPVVSLAALVALFVVRAERRDTAFWSAAVATALLAGLLLRDYILYPNSPVSGLPVSSFEVPKVWNPRVPWAALLGAFALFALLGFGADGRSSLDLRATPRRLRTQWQAGLPHKLWLVAGTLVLLALLIVGVLAYAIPERLHMTTLALKWARRAVFVPLAIPATIVCAQLALVSFAKLGRFRLLPLVVTGCAVGVYSAQGYLPGLSEHFSPREIYETYNRLAKPGETLGEYQVGGRAATYYAKGKVVELRSAGALVDHLAARERRWVAFPADELANLDRAYRKRSGDHIIVADSRSARVLLGTNLPLSGKRERSFLEDHVRKAPPGTIQHPIAVSFDDRIELLGYDLALPHGDHVGAGESFKVTWYFRSIRNVAGEYRLFVHIDGAGQRIHGDHDPVDGKYPVRLWDEGDVIFDKQTLDVPATYRGGDFTIYLGFYSGDNRLSIKRGPHDGENRAVLGVLRIR